MSADDVRSAVASADLGRAMKAAREALSGGESLADIDAGLDAAIVEAEKGYEAGKIIFPKLMNIVKTVYAVREELDIPRPDLGKAVVAALDSHTEGRNTMALFLGIAGFQTQIVEMGMMEDDIVGFCKDPEVTACCVSGEFASVASKMRKIAALMEKEGVRDKVVYNAGGMTVSQEAAEKAGVDVFSVSGAESVRLIKEMVLKRKGA